MHINLVRASQPFHMPYTRLAHGRLVVNPGSVGMPYGRDGRA